MKFSIGKVLVANRGEIACRIIRTLQKMNVKSVAVCSDADMFALHTKMCNEIYKLNSNNLSDSYLSHEKIIEAARRSDCDAIHPGYGFLSENAEFAERCENNNIIFIGPPVQAMRKMGIKNVAKSIMESANVPILPGYHGNDQTVERLRTEAIRIGFPVIIKPVLGGGGKGMKIVRDEREFGALLESSRREGLKFFGDANVMIEKFVTNSRHVEVQIFADRFGNFVHLNERDCSIQRRHQKILEESPATNISDQVRQKLSEAAVAAARAVNYVGAGTIEFLFDNDNQQFYFMEMNTRLQVEHPVTEMMTGIDLVEWQIKVAAGHKLPLRQHEIRTRHGHAIETRIYAEDTDNNFMPTCGSITAMTRPASDSNLRIDTGVQVGDEIGVLYDPMIAKVIAFGDNRSKAIELLSSSLKQFHIAGLKTNISFLINLITSDEFNDSERIHTNFIDEHGEILMQRSSLSSSSSSSSSSSNIRKQSLDQNILIRVTLALALHDTYRTRKLAVERTGEHNSFVENVGFRLNHCLIRSFHLKHNNDDFRIKVKFLRAPNTYEIQLNDETAANCWRLVRAKLLTATDTGEKLQIEFEIDNLITRNEVFVCCADQYREGMAAPAAATAPAAASADDFNTVSIFSDGYLYEFRTVDDDREHIRTIKSAAAAAAATTTTTNAHTLKSPLPGIVEKVYVSRNDRIKAGEPLVLIVSMKMEHAIKAPVSGTVANVYVHDGDQIRKDTPLIELSV